MLVLVRRRNVPGSPEIKTVMIQRKKRTLKYSVCCGMRASSFLIGVASVRVVSIALLVAKSMTPSMGIIDAVLNWCGPIISKTPLRVFAKRTANRKEK